MGGIGAHDEVVVLIEREVRAAVELGTDAIGVEHIGGFDVQGVDVQIDHLPPSGSKGRRHQHSHDVNPQFHGAKLHKIAQTSRARAHNWRRGA